MSYGGYDWEQFVRMLMYEVPNVLCWCVAIFFCMTRRRENPKGAAFLGLAVLVSLFTNVVWYAWPLLVDWLGFSGLPIFGGIEFVLVGFHAVTTITFWVLIMMAVFARPAHFDYHSSPAFDDAFR